MNSGLEILSRWINGLLTSAAPVLRAPLAQENGPVLQLCERLGLLRRVGIANELSCAVCAVDPHPCRVMRTANGQYRYYCLANGWINLREEDVILLALDREALLTALASVIAVSPRGIKAFADGQLTRLGFVTPSTGCRGWMLGYADRLENANVIASVTGALAEQFPDGPGLIATPSPIHMNVPLPRKYRLIALHDLVFAREDKLVIDRSEVAIRLGERERTPGQPGRPTHHHTTERLWGALKSRPGWPTTKKDQAELILSGGAQLFVQRVHQACEFILISGENVNLVLQNPLARDWWLRDLLLALPPLLLKCITWFILLVEISFAPLALSRRLRPWLWGLMFGVQLGFATLLSFPDLTIAMLLFHLLTFDPKWLLARSLAGVTVFLTAAARSVTARCAS